MYCAFAFIVAKGFTAGSLESAEYVLIKANQRLEFAQHLLINGVFTSGQVIGLLDEAAVDLPDHKTLGMCVD